MKPRDTCEDELDDAVECRLGEELSIFVQREPVRLRKPRPSHPPEGFPNGRSIDEPIGSCSGIALRDWRSEIEFVYRSRRAEGVHHRASLYRVDNLTRCTAKDACKIEGLAGAQSKEGLLDHARVTPRCAGRAATAANGMPRQAKS